MCNLRLKFQLDIRVDIILLVDTNAYIFVESEVPSVQSNTQMFCSEIAWVLVLIINHSGQALTLLYKFCYGL